MKPSDTFLGDMCPDCKRIKLARLQVFIPHAVPCGLIAFSDDTSAHPMWLLADDASIHLHSSILPAKIMSKIEQGSYWDVFLLPKHEKIMLLKKLRPE
jgi:hypothetical protein